MWRDREGNTKMEERPEHRSGIHRGGNKKKREGE